MQKVKEYNSKKTTAQNEEGKYINASAKYESEYNKALNDIKIKKYI
ncbi:MAG: hypothetical protein L6U99_05860 [Clostridium sp.]|nr:MAG: hypothetical protein L6U99_05860 [Clostridium sp.]